MTSPNLLDQALVALAAGDRRTILELVRDQPGPLGAMAERLGTSHDAVSRDLSVFHDLEYEGALEQLASGYDKALLEAAGLEGGYRVLDVGCGSGSSSRSAARAIGTGSVLGVDLSAATVRRAETLARAEGLSNVAFHQGDAATAAFDPASFDVVISRFGAMYFGHPAHAFTNLAQALRPGGRLALAARRDAERNKCMTEVAGALAMGRTLPERPGAFGLAREAHVRSMLGEAGFVDVILEERSEPVTFGPDAAAAYALVSTQGLARGLLGGLDVAARKTALARLRAVLEAHETPHGVLFGSTCWLVTARRPETPASPTVQVGGPP